MPSKLFPADSPPPQARFVTTRWSVVLQAKDRTAPQARDALAELCQTYWYPLYAFVRRRARDAHDAQDLTQGFFARLLEKDYLVDVQPQKGRFRAFLLAAVKHFLSNERDKARAAKRGGGRQIVSLPRVMSLDWESGESRFLTEPAHDLTAERMFERQWAVALLDRVLNRLRDNHAAAGKLPQFELLQPFLTTDRQTASYSEAARQLTLTEDATRVAAHRLRKRYRELLREEIAQTVATPEEAADEIRYLFAVLASPA